MPKIQVLVGMIASGKSTYCCNAAHQGMLILNDDSIVNMLHGGIYTLYDKSLKILYKSLENQTVSMVLLANKNIVIDRGLNISAQGRQRWIALARSFDVICEAIVFKNEGPEIHAQRRNKSDARGYSDQYWIDVAKAHHDVFALPTVEEGFESVHHISFDEILQGRIL